MIRRLLLLGITSCTLLACDRTVDTTPSTKAISPTTPPVTSPKTTQQKQKPAMANTPPTTRKTYKTTNIILNRQHIGHLKISKDDSHIALSFIDGGQKLSFGSHVKSVEAIQMIDLAKTQTMRQGLLNWPSLSTHGLRQPALLVRIKRVWPTSKEERKRTAKSKMPKVRDKTETQWQLLSTNPPYSVIWRHTVSYQSSDGFGGHRLHSLKWHSGKTWRITATRQDQLPAYKSRCRRPKPYPVEFIYTSGFFKKQPVKRRGGPCSR